MFLSLLLNDTFFCKRPVLIVFCMLGKCSCFCFRLLTFFKINKPPGMATIGVSNSLDPDQDPHSLGLHLGSNCLQEAIDRQIFRWHKKEL